MTEQMPPDNPYDRFHQNEDGVGNVDPSCLLLSNQAKLESNQANLASMLKMLLLLANPACSDFSKSDCPRENGCSIDFVDYAGEASTEAGEIPLTPAEAGQLAAEASAEPGAADAGGQADPRQFIECQQCGQTDGTQLRQYQYCLTSLEPITYPVPNGCSIISTNHRCAGTWRLN